jgi:hypothetical protein
VWVAGVSAKGGRDVGGADAAQERDRGVAQGRHHLRRGAAADLAAVLIEGHVPHPMQTVLDLPVAPHEPQQTLRACLLGRQTRDQVVSLSGGRSVLGHVTHQASHLGQMGPVRPVIQRGRSGEFADLVPITALLTRPGRSGPLAPRVEEQRDPVV